MNNKKRSTFSGGFGFVLAAAGSAVGLGNIWRSLTSPQNTAEVYSYYSTYFLS